MKEQETQVSQDQPDVYPEVKAIKVPKGRAEGRDEGYWNLLSYIVTNSVSGEIMAVENYSEMVHLMPTTDAKIDTVKQAMEESKHIKLLSKLGKRLDFTVKEEMIEPQWQTIRDHFSAAVRKKDLAACLIIQDLMTETMAIMLYKTLAGFEDADADGTTKEIAQNILKDELEHLGIGIARVSKMMEEDSEAVHDALVWAHHRVMPELFSMISTSCHFLCDVIGVDCASLSISKLATDMDALRFGALDQYIETLDRAGFDPKVTTPLIASMSAYEGMPQATVGGEEAGAPCC